MTIATPFPNFISFEVGVLNNIFYGGFKDFDLVGFGKIVVRKRRNIRRAY